MLFQDGLQMYKSMIKQDSNLKLFDADDDEIMMEWTGGTEWINL